MTVLIGDVEVLSDGTGRIWLSVASRAETGLHALRLNENDPYWVGITDAEKRAYVGKSARAHTCRIAGVSHYAVIWMEAIE